MSDAYECDRCGGLYSGHPTGYYEHNAAGLEHQAQPRAGDLCSDCSTDFKKFIEGDTDDE